VTGEIRREGNQMSQTKTQKAAAARAKKTAAQQEVQPVAETKQPAAVEQSKPATQTAKPAPAAAAPAQPSKQTQTIEKLTVALREQRQIEVKPEMLVQDGKYINLLIGKEWPVIQIGASGGIVLPAIKSYPKAFPAALEGDKLLAKQNEREAKKTAAPTQPAAKAPADKQQATA
jgi:hypothetical protein